jgi:hypothetical protein
VLCYPACRNTPGAPHALFSSQIQAAMLWHAAPSLLSLAAAAVASNSCNVHPELLLHSLHVPSATCVHVAACGCHLAFISGQSGLCACKCSCAVAYVIVPHTTLAAPFCCCRLKHHLLKEVTGPFLTQIRTAAAWRAALQPSLHLSLSARILQGQHSSKQCPASCRAKTSAFSFTPAPTAAAFEGAAAPAAA